MKPKTKKIIIAAAVLAVAFILWLVFRKKGAKSLIDRLGLTEELRNQMESKVAEVEAYANLHPTGTDGWSRESIQTKANDRGVSYEQMVLIEAAYSLYTLNVVAWSEYSTIEERIKSL